MQGVDPVQPSPSHQSWHEIFREALLHAQQQVRPLRWRGTLGGVLPHGYDPNSIAAETILELLRRQPSSPDAPSPGPPHLLPGELRRLVWRHIDRLHHRKENFLTLNEPDLDTTFTDDGEPVRVIELIPSSEPNPLETLLDEEAAETEHVAAQFSQYLGKERRLRKLFGLLHSGITRPKTLARKLKLKAQTIASLRKRLARRLAEFQSSKTSAEIQIT